jgi:hypothetical protein
MQFKFMTTITPLTVSLSLSKANRSFWNHISIWFRQAQPDIAQYNN